jgi:hypothetical protein
VRQSWQWRVSSRHRGGHRGRTDWIASEQTIDSSPIVAQGHRDLRSASSPKIRGLFRRRRRLGKIASLCTWPRAIHPPVKDNHSPWLILLQRTPTATQAETCSGRQDSKTQESKNSKGDVARVCEPDAVYLFGAMGG